MNGENDTNEPGETVGVVSGIQLPDFEPRGGDLPGPAGGDPIPQGGSPGKAVLFISDDVDRAEVLNNVEVVLVKAAVIEDQILRRT